jgi:hypothetical protein
MNEYGALVDKHRMGKKQKYSAKNLSQYNFVRHKSQMGSPEPLTLRHHFCALTF